MIAKLLQIIYILIFNIIETGVPMEEYNPWWVGEEDPVYGDWRVSPVRWVPSVLRLFETKPYSLNFIVGPRQVGKTTAIKIYIHEILLRRMDPKAIFYYPCDELSDYKELGEVLDDYLSARKAWGIRSSYIFLDEITFVEEWWRALKSRIDRGAFKNDVIYVMGSASIELLRRKEMFPGRRGLGRDICFLPMDFSEYAEKFGNLTLKRGTLSDFENAMSANKLFSTRLTQLFQMFLKTGGFPVPIREYFERGKISALSIKTYLDWIRNDWARAGKSDKYMKEILTYILRARLSPISWLGITKETSINSPNTARSYVETLEDLFIVKVLNIISPDGRVLYRKNKKIHITDPFLYHVLSQYTGVQVLEEHIVESTVAAHVSRAHETYYWRNGTEIDVVAVVNGEQVGIEVKWGLKRWRKPRHIKHLILLDRENLPLFLASVSWMKEYRTKPLTHAS